MSDYLKNKESSARCAQPGITLALGGGAIKGICHAGVFKALEEAGIPIRAVAGTSAGAVAAAQYAYRPEADWVAKRTSEYLLSGAFTGTKFEQYLIMARDPRICLSSFSSLWQNAMMLRRLLRQESILSAESHRRFIFGIIPKANIESTQLPLAVVALDLVSGSEVCMKSGSLQNAVLASTCIAGVFPPVVRENFRLVDAGWMRAMPVQAARAHAAGPVVAVNVGADFSPRTGDENGLMRFWEMLESHAHLSRSMAEANADLTLKPDVSAVKLPLTDEIIADSIHAGERAVKEALPKLRRMLFSAQDNAILDLALRHRFLEPETAPTVVSEAAHHPQKDLSLVLLRKIGPSAFSLLRELATL